VKVHVEVTERDIAKGEPGKPCGCPVARAVRRSIGYRKHVFVDEGAIYGSKFRVRFPPGVGDFVVKFDNHQPVKPFAFDLVLP
jgi:hypothetical protein